MEFLNNIDINALVDGTKLLAVLGLLAFLVSCITEVLKAWKWLDKKIPSALLVTGLSLAICPAALLGMMSYAKQPITWYEVFASFLAAFIVALVSMNGWEHVTDLAKRMLRK